MYSFQRKLFAFPKFYVHSLFAVCWRHRWVAWNFLAFSMRTFHHHTLYDCWPKDVMVLISETKQNRTKWNFRIRFQFKYLNFLEVSINFHTPKFFGCEIDCNSMDRLDCQTLDTMGSAAIIPSYNCVSHVMDTIGLPSILLSQSRRKETKTMSERTICGGLDGKILKMQEIDALWI